MSPLEKDMPPRRTDRQNEEVGLTAFSSHGDLPLQKPGSTSALVQLLQEQCPATAQAVGGGQGKQLSTDSTKRQGRNLAFSPLPYPLLRSWSESNCSLAVSQDRFEEGSCCMYNQPQIPTAPP